MAPCAARAVSSTSTTPPPSSACFRRAVGSARPPSLCCAASDSGAGPSNPAEHEAGPEPEEADRGEQQYAESRERERPARVLRGLSARSHRIGHGERSGIAGLRRRRSRVGCLRAGRLHTAPRLARGGAAGGRLGGRLRHRARAAARRAVTATPPFGWAAPPHPLRI